MQTFNLNSHQTWIFVPFTDMEPQNIVNIAIVTICTFLFHFIIALFVNILKRSILITRSSNHMFIGAQI